MGLLGKIIKRQSAEDSEDLDFDDEMVDSLDMPGEEDGPSGGILGKVLKRRGKGESEDTDEAEEADQDESEQDEVVQDEAVQDEDPGITEGPAPEEDSPVQVVRLEGIPDVHPVGESNPSMAPGQEQTGPGAQPAENSSPAEANTPIDPAVATEGDTSVGDTGEGDTAEDSSNTDGGDLALSLQDIFGEEQEVDESLRDLADFVEDTLAQDLAGELREFLEELEARQK